MTHNVRSELANGSMDRLKSEATELLSALGDRAISSIRDQVEGAAGRLSEYTEGGGGPGLLAAVTGAKGLAEGKGPARAMLGAGMTNLKEKTKGMLGGGGKGGGQGKNLKVTNIVESIDVGVPVSVAYNQWTQFTDFPSFMKKVESVEQQEDEKLSWRVQILWSHRDWESDILEQVPEDKIIWRSKGAKGYVDGAVTFHELAPSLTRILLVLEYHPQGFFEHTGNLWRAQGRRARLELKHFRRHVMCEVLLHPEELEGWRGVIHDGEVAEDGASDEGNERRDQNGRTSKQFENDASDEGNGRHDRNGRRASKQPGEQRDERGEGGRPTVPAARRATERGDEESRDAGRNRSPEGSRETEDGQRRRRAAGSGSRSPRGGSSRDSSASRRPTTGKSTGGSSRTSSGSRASGGGT